MKGSDFFNYKQIKDTILKLISINFAKKAPARKFWWRPKWEIRAKISMQWAPVTTDLIILNMMIIAKIFKLEIIARLEGLSWIIWPNRWHHRRPLALNFRFWRILHLLFCPGHLHSDAQPLICQQSNVIHKEKSSHLWNTYTSFQRDQRSDFQGLQDAFLHQMVHHVSYYVDWSVVQQLHSLLLDRQTHEYEFHVFD